MLEGFERHIGLITQATGVPTSDAFDREDAAVLLGIIGGQQQVFVLFAVQADWLGVMLEQIDDRRAVKLYVVQCRAHPLDTAFANIEAQFQAPHLFDAATRSSVDHVQAIDVDEEELVLEGEVFLQVAIAAEGVQRIGNQGFVFGKPHRLHAACG
ncbi:hypothetical protein FQZ97_1022820 [compost metagenome]